MSKKIEIEIMPTKILFFNDDTFFGIYGAKVVNEEDIEKYDIKINEWGTISIKGVMPRLEMGQKYSVILKEDFSEKYKTYVVEKIEQVKPKTAAEQRLFLESILTPNQVNNIYEVYDESDDIVGMIENGTFDYTKVKGIGEVTFERLKEKVLANIDMSEILAFLTKHGLKYNTISPLLKEFKDPQIVIQKIEGNPYLLTRFKGIGFKKADEIAKAIGYSMTSPNRIDACLKYCIGMENQAGHCWVEEKKLVDTAVDLLNIERQYIEKRLNEAETIINIDGKYTTRAIYNAEKFVAQSLIRLKTQSKPLFQKEEIDKFLDEYCKKHNVRLEKEQRQFFYDFNENAVLFLIGGGGVGKSWLQRILLELLDTKNLRVALLAPTGKASKVMANYTGRQASTIHRKIGLHSRNEDDDEGEFFSTITEDVCIVDEISMCDIFLMSNFFKALDNSTVRILFVGDDFQLPSVGVGNFLHDVIHSNCIKITRLKKVFRQKDGGILNVSTDVRNGKRFLSNDADGRIVFGKDCVFWMTDQQYIRDGVLVNYKKVLKRYNPDDVIVLTPTNKGMLGTFELNKEIQKIVNPPSALKKEKTFGKEKPVTFRVGDSVMNLVNTYELETLDGRTANIFNGDTGKIIDINEEEKIFIVEFDDIKIKMSYQDVFSNLVHAWAMTIHKSQGSQYKVVIVVTDKSMTYQLNANLLYTGFSRAKEYMLVLGQAKTINIAMNKFANMERRSFLKELLVGYDSGNLDEVGERQVV